MDIELKQLLGQIGQGIILPVAYDTAIVALVPKFKNLSKPSFPESLQWLRRHQLSDGSWGSDKPTYTYGNVLSTLAAIIALKKWTNNSEEDINRITRGEAALHVLAECMGTEKYESIGYEILLPMLLTQAVRFGLRVPINRLDIRHAFEEKYESIKAHQQSYGWNKRHTFWYSLEMIAGLTHPSDQELFAINDCLLEANGSVSASPSATAFYLMSSRVEKSIDVPKADHYIRELVDANGGGVPPLFPSDTFELSFSLSALLMAGFPPKHPIMTSAVDKLELKWNQFNGYVGCSSYLPPDIDAIASFVYVLNSTNRSHSSDSSDSLQKMIKFFNEKYFICFCGERNASISVNINALFALKSYPINDRIQDLMSKVVDWLKSQIPSDASELIFSDKWHISAYYSISRAVFALQGIDDQLAQTCVHQLLRHQNEDFGWGLDGSTLEETALVALALCHWFRTNSNQINEQNLKLLQTIQNFMNEFNGKPDVHLWIAKSLYCPILVVRMFVISAKYSLNKTVDLFEFSLNSQITQ